MKNLTLRNITEVCQGIYHGQEKMLDKEVTAITTDSRKIEQDCLFVPIVGERVDAHKFIPDVMTKGALATLSERELPEAEYPYIQIKSSLQAVKDIAEFETAEYSCSGYYRKCWKNQYKRSDRFCSERKIPYSENTGEF